jgi:hypothetical protein
MPRVFAALALICLGLRPAPASSQTMADLLRSIWDGGGWVRIPIERGRGTLESDALPTLGLTLTGCAQVYAGHSGRWAIRARDVLGDGGLDVEVDAGEAVPFSYTTGARSQLALEARWSEARDTTLLVWVGLESRALPARDVCLPVYGEGSG